MKRCSSAWCHSWVPACMGPLAGRPCAPKRAPCAPPQVADPVALHITCLLALQQARFSCLSWPSCCHACRERSGS